jgi:NAD-dependent deacetylase
MALATPEAFRRDPALVWAWYEWRRGLVLQAEPNAGHRAIAELARRVPRFTLVTQSVDDLHERAESDPVIHVHGQILRPYCEACLCSYRFPPGLPIERERIEPPRCKACGARVRPGVVWFGDPMPHGAWKLARDAAASCDLMLCVGTSGAVATATSLVQLALTSKALVVDINPEPGKLGAGVISLRGTAGAVLPQLVAT